jgi:regulator of replication initiation timing
MEKLDIFRTIIDIIAVIIAGGWLVRLFTVKSRVKQGKAEADKTVEEAKNAQIENVRKMIDEVYQSTIISLKNDVKDLRDEMLEIKDENGELKKRMAELEEENTRLRKENEELRDALREIRPDVVPSRRSINAQNQTRNERGQFVKETE